MLLLISILDSLWRFHHSSHCIQLVWKASVNSTYGRENFAAEAPMWRQPIPPTRQVMSIHRDSSKRWTTGKWHTCRERRQINTRHVVRKVGQSHGRRICSLYMSTGRTWFVSSDTVGNRSRFLLTSFGLATSANGIGHSVTFSPGPRCYFTSEVTAHKL